MRKPNKLVVIGHATSDLVLSFPIYSKYVQSSNEQISHWSFRKQLLSLYTALQPRILAFRDTHNKITNDMHIHYISENSAYLATVYLINLLICIPNFCCPL